MHLTDRKNLPGIHFSLDCKAFCLLQRSCSSWMWWSMNMWWQTWWSKSISVESDATVITSHSSQERRRAQQRRASAPSCGELWDCRRIQGWLLEGRRGLGKENIWREDTQLQDPSTGNTCVMLNRMDKWERGWNNGVPLHWACVGAAGGGGGLSPSPSITWH